ncbi:Uncharacterised protein [Klebsiella quasivariicola]|nr:Uncharacterised protein [Klebsiella quasivariicola]
MANFVIRLVQDLGHEADITDEIAGVPIHFDGIYEGREAGHKLQGRMKINRRRWKRGQHQVCRPNAVFQERIKVRTTIKENKVVVMLELVDNVLFKHRMNIFPWQMFFTQSLPAFSKECIVNGSGDYINTRDNRRYYKIGK